MLYLPLEDLSLYHKKFVKWYFIKVLPPLHGYTMVGDDVTCDKSSSVLFLSHPTFFGRAPPLSAMVPGTWSVVVICLFVAGLALQAVILLLMLIFRVHTLSKENDRIFVLFLVLYVFCFCFLAVCSFL